MFCEAEAILNSRPLSTVSSDPHDLEPLTPNHILLLKSVPILPFGTFLKSDLYARRHWKQVQYMADLFWCRWTKECLLLLQERQKWITVKKNLNDGNIVLVVDPTAPQGSWPLGRVLETKPHGKGLNNNIQPTGELYSLLKQQRDEITELQQAMRELEEDNQYLRTAFTESDRGADHSHTGVHHPNPRYCSTARLKSNHRPRMGSLRPPPSPPLKHHH
ncbi:hypothetical protein SRHO_G00193610 [Serrasalmus rhombeus]